MTVQVIWSVFQISMSAVMVLHRIYNDRLKPPPTHRDDQWVVGFQLTIIPSVML